MIGLIICEMTLAKLTVYFDMVMRFLGSLSDVRARTSHYYIIMPGSRAFSSVSEAILIVNVF